MGSNARKRYEAFMEASSSYGATEGVVSSTLAVTDGKSRGSGKANKKRPNDEDSVGHWPLGSSANQPVRKAFHHRESNRKKIRNIAAAASATSPFDLTDDAALSSSDYGGLTEEETQRKNYYSSSSDGGDEPQASPCARKVAIRERPLTAGSSHGSTFERNGHNEDEKVKVTSSNLLLEQVLLKEWLQRHQRQQANFAATLSQKDGIKDSESIKEDVSTLLAMGNMLGSPAGSTRVTQQGSAASQDQWLLQLLGGTGVPMPPTNQANNTETGDSNLSYLLSQASQQQQQQQQQATKPPPVSASNGQSNMLNALLAGMATGQNSSLASLPVGLDSLSQSQQGASSNKDSIAALLSALLELLKNSSTASAPAPPPPQQLRNANAMQQLLQLLQQQELLQRAPAPQPLPPPRQDPNEALLQLLLLNSAPSQSIAARPLPPTSISNESNNSIAQDARNLLSAEQLLQQLQQQLQVPPPPPQPQQDPNAALLQSLLTHLSGAGISAGVTNMVPDRCPDGAPPRASSCNSTAVRTRFPLAMPADADHLSPYQAAIRRHLEFFVSQREDADFSVQGRPRRASWHPVHPLCALSAPSSQPRGRLLPRQTLRYLPGCAEHVVESLDPVLQLHSRRCPARAHSVAGWSTRFVGGSRKAILGRYGRGFGCVRR